MLEQLLACLAGVITGYVVGLMPGIGVTVMMILLFGILTKIPVLMLLIFYTCCVSACQFGGSVTALATGLPGETNSFPLIKIRNSIISNGQQSDALFVCAAGHLIGAISTFSLSFLIIDWIAGYTDYLKTIALIGFSTAGLILCCLFSESRWYFVMLSVIAAWTLSRIGTNFHTGEQFLTFDNAWLSGGLPVISVVLGAYAMPNIINSLRQSKITVDTEFKSDRPSKKSLITDNIGPIARGSVLGYIAGLIPYVGVDLSSYLAYYSERLLKRDHMSQIAAAETATNAAGIAMLLPLLIFGIAVQPSENLLLEITNSTSYVLNWNTVKPMFIEVSAWLVIANLLSFILSWNLARPVIDNLSNLGKIVPWMLCLLCVYSAYSIGVDYNQGIYYLIVMAAFSLLGWLLRDQDTLPFIFVFMLQDKLEPAIIRIYTLYS
jgi:putative tricarboxylic transport membrane protein